MTHTAFILGMVICVATQQAGNDRVVPVYPDWVLEGLTMEPSGGMTVKLNAGVARLGGRDVAIAAAQFELAPPTSVRVHDEQLVLSEEKPSGWAHGTSLKQCTCFGNGHGTPLPGCLKPGSLRVKSAAGEEGQVFEEGKDYLVDWNWDKLGRVAEGAIKRNQTVFVDYEYRLVRLDSIIVKPDGSAALVAGESKPTCPLPPPIDADAARLANILVWFDTQEIVQGLLFPCGPVFPEPDRAERERRQQLVSRTLAKLQAGQEVTIVTWGDSVTAGGDAQPPERAFPYAFANELRVKYPQAKVNLVNAGIGGSSTNSRLAGLEQDVIAHKPDLVTIEFVNDCGLSPEKLQQNWHEAIGKISAAGGEVIIITPHWTMPPWMGMSYADQWGRDRRPAVEAMRKVAADLSVGLADTSRRWEHLAQEGLPYVTLLWNGINHPDNRGHWLFVQDLMTYF